MSTYQAITPDEWVAIFNDQEGRCCLCEHLLWNRYSGKARDKKTERAPALDHDHKIEKEKNLRASIRGILCAYPCNRILLRQMTVQWLQRAVVYVNGLPAQAVLNS